MIATSTRTKNPRATKAIAPIETAQEAIATLDDEISQLLAEATEAEETMLNAGKAAAQLYFKLGDRLSQRKSEIGHGRWLKWLKERGLPERKIQRANQIYAEFINKPDSLTDLTLTEALKECSKKRSLPAAEQNEEAIEAETQSPRSIDELKELFASVGIVEDWGKGFSVKRPDLGAPFPLAFRNVGEANKYWDRNNAKLLALAERKPMPEHLQANHASSAPNSGQEEAIAHQDDESITENKEASLSPEIKAGDENYTSSELIDRVRAVLGRIDLDPSSNELANLTVQATRFFSIHDDGLKQAWEVPGRDKITVWDNCPYSFPLVQEFSDRLVSEWESGTIEGAIAIRNNCTDTKWFQNLASTCTVRLDLRGREQFYNPYQSYDGGNRQGQTLFYFGSEPGKFYQEFEGKGLFYPPAPVQGGDERAIAPLDDETPVEAVSTVAAAEVLGLSEIHYAVRKFAALNERDWDESRVDEIATQLLTVLSEF